MQRVTIRPDGSIAGLDHKKKGLSLRQFGKATIQRVTLVEWDEDHQGWYIRWFGRKGGKVWSHNTFEVAKVRLYDFEAKLAVTNSGAVPMFEDYEEAVRAEVAVLQSLQALGTLPPWGEGEETTED